MLLLLFTVPGRNRNVFPVYLPAMFDPLFCIVLVGQKDKPNQTWVYPSFCITINVPVVYMALNVMILMGANPFRGPLQGKGMGLKNRYFFGP